MGLKQKYYGGKKVCKLLKMKATEEKTSKPANKKRQCITLGKVNFSTSYSQCFSSYFLRFF
jgi:hypothetical protein